MTFQTILSGKILVAVTTGRMNPSSVSGQIAWPSEQLTTYITHITFRFLVFYDHMTLRILYVFVGIGTQFARIHLFPKEKIHVLRRRIELSANHNRMDQSISEWVVGSSWSSPFWGRGALPLTHVI